MESKDEFRRKLTARLIEEISNGTAPWQRPWSKSIPPLPHNPVTEKPYRGANSLWLSMQNFSDSRWMTYKQASENGWQVRKGEKGTLIEYWKIFEEKENNENAVETAKNITLQRPQVFRAIVFNAEQIDDIPPIENKIVDWTPHDSAEALLKGSGAFIRHDQQSRAFYRPASDSIHLPHRSQFHDSNGYYATALHELAHWTGHSSRLNRDQQGAYGTADYAREELRAEIGAYFICATLGIPSKVHNHASYIDSWCASLAEDHNELFRAARDAARIQDFILQSAPNMTPTSLETQQSSNVAKLDLRELGKRAGSVSLPHPPSSRRQLV